MVLAGLVTAWRLASCPTSRSPVLVKATTDGMVRPPSADAMTVGSPPSITATTEFVVPRSIPMILPMAAQCSCGSLGSVRTGWCLIGGGPVVGTGAVRGARAVRGRVLGGDGDERRPQHAVAQPVAAAE